MFLNTNLLVNPTHAAYHFGLTTTLHYCTYKVVIDYTNFLPLSATGILLVAV